MKDGLLEVGDHLYDKYPHTDKWYRVGTVERVTAKFAFLENGRKIKREYKGDNTDDYRLYNPQIGNNISCWQNENYVKYKVQNLHFIQDSILITEICRLIKKHEAAQVIE